MEMNRNWERAKTRCGAPCLCRGSKVGAAEPLSRGVPEDQGDRAAEGREAHFPADVLLQVRRETLWERVGRAEPTPHLASETLALQTSRLTAGGQEPGQGPQRVQGWASRQASWCGKPPALPGSCRLRAYTKQDPRGQWGPGRLTMDR